MHPQYIFTSERLGFRNWIPADIPLLAAINADPVVMEFFPGIKSTNETIAFVGRMQQQFAANGYCYFAVDTLADNEFIGFTGISQQTFASPYTPCHDIGWRLAKDKWGRGYATEGAKACIGFAFGQLAMDKLSAIAPKVNVRSESVMVKAGMKKIGEFAHPLLPAGQLKECVVYEILNNNKTR